MVRLTQAEKTQLTRVRLKESALKAFARKGVNSTGIEEIARGAGYSRGAFYGNYGSKLELLIDSLSEKHSGEVRLWREAMDGVGNPEAALVTLSERYENISQSMLGSLLAVELQLEAERNPKFRPVFKKHLDSLYSEIRSVLKKMLRRNGKAAPANLDSIVVASRLLGLGLGSQTILGEKIGARTTPSKILLEFLRGVIQAAPPLTDASDEEEPNAVDNDAGKRRSGRKVTGRPV